MPFLSRKLRTPGVWRQVVTRVIDPAAGSAAVRGELLFFSLLLVWANTSLLAGRWNHSGAFFPVPLANGEWWRLVTHPWVHVSWYHLLLDGAAFLMLCAELGAWNRWRRLGAIMSGALGSLLAALSSPIVASHGFCGLSGIAHGLMAVSALEMIRANERYRRSAGLLALGCVVAKTLIEAFTGNVLLSFLHFGLMGSPVAACHAGGVLGGLIFWLLLRQNCRAVPSNHVAPVTPETAAARTAENCFPVR